jgi:UDP-N-acetylglucosamine 1-carboxyvinyltransferase
MSSFLIEGGHSLQGEVVPSGNKNAAIALLPACILTDEPVVLHNIPDIGDVRTFHQILQSIGMQIEVLSPNSWRLHARDINPTDLNTDLCRKIRASVLLAGPMLGRGSGIDMPPPGGDVIGRRRVDTHLIALEALGAKTKFDGRSFQLRAPRRLVGADILLDEASVTATENAVMASVTAKGTTILRNAASEPHVQDLCNFLNHLGARIENVGSNTLHIEGVDKLHGGEYTIGADYMEVVSFIGAAAVTGGEIRIRNASPEHLDMIGLNFARLGVSWSVEGDDLLVPGKQSLTVLPDVGGAIPEINVMPWPAFPTDLMSIAIVVATQANGTVLFHDWMYEGRMFFIDKLVAMGARILLCDPHRCVVQGPTKLIGEQLESPDIRAGLALVLAALAAEGTSRIRNIMQIERGYERIDQKLKALGARIERVED